MCQLNIFTNLEFKIHCCLNQNDPKNFRVASGLHPKNNRPFFESLKSFTRDVIHFGRAKTCLQLITTEQGLHSMICYSPNMRILLILFSFF